VVGHDDLDLLHVGQCRGRTTMSPPHFARGVEPRDGGDDGGRDDDRA
jgi:hypothetical protein